MKPQHLKDLIGKSADENGEKLLSSLTLFVNHVLDGKTPASARPFFGGATLLALQKKNGGIRPIAIGCTLHRLAAKCASNMVMNEMGDILKPHQLGYGSPYGAEAAVHATRLYLENLQSNQVLLKLDFQNAFNCIRRDKMLMAVERFAPSLYPFVHSLYSSQSSLFWEEETICSSEGVQQGDPLGPLLFCLSIHHLVTSLKSEFCIFYLDDGTLGGSSNEVFSDLQNVEQAAEDLGFHLNREKCEIICCDPVTKEQWLATSPDLLFSDPESATLLGSPLGDVNSISESITEKIQLLSTMGNRLQLLQAHDAIILLRHSVALPKMLYLLRTCPTFTSPQLQSYDDLLRSLLSSIINVNFTLNDPAWSQASLPVGSGGLGIRSAVQLAPSAFLASAAATASLVLLLLPPNLHNVSYPAKDTALLSWSTGHSESPPSAPLSSSQKAWDEPRIKLVLTQLLNHARADISRACIIAASTKPSGAWLNALLVSSLGLRMDNSTLRIAVGLRLGIPLVKPHQCCHCSAEVSPLATHGLSCRHSEGRHQRHASINNILHRAFASAKIPSRLEPSGLYRSDGKRPDGMTLIPWKRSRILVWDATCWDTFAPSNLPQAIREAGAVAAKAEQIKEAKYSHLDTSHLFIPIAFETSGSLGPTTAGFIKELAHLISRENDEPLAHQYLLQRLSVAIQRGNAISV